MRPKRSSVRATISSGTPAAATSPGTASARSPSDVGQRFGALAIAHVDRDRRAALVQALGGGAAETARGAGDDRDASGEVAHWKGRVYVRNVAVSPQLCARRSRILPLPMHKRLLLVFLAPLPVAARAANWPEHPVLHAVRATRRRSSTATSPIPRGRRRRSSPTSRSTIPMTASRRRCATSVRIVYDDHAIYFGVKMTDPQQPTALLVRRDTFSQSDFLSINIDPQHDRLSGNAFTVTPAGVQVRHDPLQRHRRGRQLGRRVGLGREDRAGRLDRRGAHPVFAAALSRTSRCTCGASTSRGAPCATTRCVRIVNTKKGETGFVSHFADIDGMEGIHRGKPLELVPYSVARSDVLTRADRSNPLLSSAANIAPTAGSIVKYALTSDLTLTGTINPDFGQVEVDPAVVNLSQFETFYPEKRPFFTEGLNIFSFGDTPAPSHFNFFFRAAAFSTRAASAARRRARPTPTSSTSRPRPRSSARRRSPASSAAAGRSACSTRSPTAEHARFVTARRSRTAAGRADDELLRLARARRRSATNRASASC